MNATVEAAPETAPELSSAYLEAVNKNGDWSTLRPSTLSDIEISWPCAPADAARIYREYGCLIVRGLLTDLAPQMLADAEEMARQVKESNFEKTGNALVMPGDKTGRGQQIMLFYPTYPYAASHFQAATDSRVLDLLEAMIGPNVEMMGDGMCMYKEPGGGMEKAMHQDAPYFYHRDHSVCSAFVHLVPTNHENSCLRVYPGSWKLGLLEHEDKFSHLALPSEKFPLEGATPIEAAPGDVVFFNYLTVHGSDNNWSTQARPALVMQYRSADDDQIWKGASHTSGLGQPNEDSHAGKYILRGRRIKF